MPKCFHTASYQIPKMCNDTPTSVAEIYYKLHIKYPRIAEYLGHMLTIEWIEAVDVAGNPAFQGIPFHRAWGQDIDRMEVGQGKFKTADYLYRITPVGSEVLNAYRTYYQTVTEQLKRVLIPVVYAGKTLQWYQTELPKARRRKSCRRS